MGSRPPAGVPADESPLLRDAVRDAVRDANWRRPWGFGCSVGPFAWLVEAGGSEVATLQAALRLPGGDTELVLATRQRYEPNWLVDSADEASARIIEAGGRVVTEPFDIPVGRVAVVADPFGNELVLIDLSKGRYRTDADGSVTGIS